MFDISAEFDQDMESKSRERVLQARAEVFGPQYIISRTKAFLPQYLITVWERQIERQKASGNMSKLSLMYNWLCVCAHVVVLAGKPPEFSRAQLRCY